MPIRDVTSGKTGGIGPIRYVENGVTVNIPIVYVVEDGKTVLVYKEKEKVYTPTGDTYYLYNRGTISEAIGSFEFTGKGSTTFKQKTGYLSFVVPKNTYASATIKSTRLMNLTAYKHVYIDYAYVNASTGAGITSIGGIFRYRLNSSSGSGKYQLMTLYNPGYIGSDSGFWEESFLDIYSGYDVFSTTEDIELRIYSIYITKA